MSSPIGWIWKCLSHGSDFPWARNVLFAFVSCCSPFRWIKKQISDVVHCVFIPTVDSKVIAMARQERDRASQQSVWQIIMSFACWTQKYILFICLGVVYNVGGVQTNRKIVASVAFYPPDSWSYGPNINNVYIFVISILWTLRIKSLFLILCTIEKVGYF